MVNMRDIESGKLRAQHAHPGGCLHFTLALMQLLPHGWPFVHFLQQVCWASSIHSDVIDSLPLPGQGV